VERTCILVKPDGVAKRRSGTVIDRLERAGLRLVGLKMLKLTRGQAESFYREHHGKPFYEPLIQFMTSGPILATAWEGVDAIQAARGLMGATNSTQAAPGTLRKEHGTDNRYNLVHGSDSPASAAREIAYFFATSELFDYGENDWRQPS
jgi:nucleoside-diphosphate kinase